MRVFDREEAHAKLGLDKGKRQFKAQINKY